MPPLPRASLSLPSTPLNRRAAVVIGAGSFGTAVAVLLARGGMRTTLQTRTPEQAQRLIEHRENREHRESARLTRRAGDELSAGIQRKPAEQSELRCHAATAREARAASSPVNPAEYTGRSGELTVGMTVR